jgi:hypothetical protein
LPDHLAEQASCRSRFLSLDCFPGAENRVNFRLLSLFISRTEEFEDPLSANQAGLEPNGYFLFR